MGLVAINRDDGEWVGQTYEREKTTPSTRQPGTRERYERSYSIFFSLFFSFMVNWPTVGI